MITTNQIPVKTAELKAPNKLTLVTLWDHNQQEEVQKYFDCSYSRIQDWVDALNSIEGNDYSVISWKYQYLNDDCY